MWLQFIPCERTINGPRNVKSEGISLKRNGENDRCIWCVDMKLDIGTGGGRAIETLV